MKEIELNFEAGKCHFKMVHLFLLHCNDNHALFPLGRVDLGSGLKKLRPSGNCEL